MTATVFIPALGHDWLTKLYDPAMATLFQERLYRLPLLDALNLQPGERILDIGCGTGTLDLLLCKRAPQTIDRTATETAWVSAALVEVIGDAKQIPIINDADSAPTVATPAATPTGKANPAATATPTASAGNLAPGQLSGRLLYSVADTEVLPLWFFEKMDWR